MCGGKGEGSASELSVVIVSDDSSGESEMTGISTVGGKVAPVVSWA